MSVFLCYYAHEPEKKPNELVMPFDYHAFRYRDEETLALVKKRFNLDVQHQIDAVWEKVMTILDEWYHNKQRITQFQRVIFTFFLLSLFGNFYLALFQQTEFTVDIYAQNFTAGMIISIVTGTIMFFCWLFCLFMWHNTASEILYELEVYFQSENKNYAEKLGCEWEVGDAASYLLFRFEPSKVFKKKKDFQDQKSQTSGVNVVRSSKSSFMSRGAKEQQSIEEMNQSKVNSSKSMGLLKMTQHDIESQSFFPDEEQGKTPQIPLTALEGGFSNTNKTGEDNVANKYLGFTVKRNNMGNNRQEQVLQQAMSPSQSITNRGLLQFNTEHQPLNDNNNDLLSQESPIRPVNAKDKNNYRH